MAMRELHTLYFSKHNSSHRQQGMLQISPVLSTVQTLDKLDLSMVNPQFPCLIRFIAPQLCTQMVEVCYKSREDILEVSFGLPAC